MPIITKDDFIDVYQKIVQRGSSFVLSKLNPNSISRTKSAFDNTAFQSSNWWIIPAIKERWNEKITGNKEIEYEEYFINKYLKGRQNLTLLSIGSGVCSHEIKFAGSGKFKKITCIDLASNLLKIAKETATSLDLHNFEFIAKDINDIQFNSDAFDIILFHSSLHHLSNIEHLISTKISTWLKPNGFVIINEYVGPNRLQFDKKQLAYINKGLKYIPNELKKRFKTSLIKTTYHGSGYLRMIIADPSECIESSKIIPVLNKEFTVLEEKGCGGNLLMSILKDISHNFIQVDGHNIEEILTTLFELEDNYLKDNSSDFVFAVYSKSGQTNA